MKQKQFSSLSLFNKIKILNGSNNTEKNYEPVLQWSEIKFSGT